MLGRAVEQGGFHTNSNQQKVLKTRIKEVDQMAQSALLTPEQVDDVIAEHEQIIKEKDPEVIRALLTNYVD